MNDGTPLNRVLMIGCANVEPAQAFSFLRNEAVGELVLVGEGAERLLGGVRDLQKMLPPARHFADARLGDCREAAGAARVAVIAAGESGRAGETRFDLLRRNAGIVRAAVRGLMAAGFGGVVLVTTGPADLLAQIALEESGLPAGRVIGSGSLLDASRLSEVFAAETADQTARDGEAPATWCAAQIGGAPFVDFCAADCPDFGKMMVQIRRAAAAREEEGGRNNGFAPRARPTPAGSCVTKICEAVLRDEKVVLPVSVMAEGQYGISGAYLSLPCVIGRRGVEQIIGPPAAIYRMEQKRLQRSADSLRQTLADLRGVAVSAIAA